MLYNDGIELLEQYYEQKILNNYMLNDVLKSMNSQCDHNHLNSYGLHLISLLKRNDVALRNKSKNELKVKLRQSRKDIGNFGKQFNNIFSMSQWYPECHNDPKKIQCDNCIGCMDDACNRSMCDRVGRCMCEGSSCKCIGR